MMHKYDHYKTQVVVMRTIFAVSQFFILGDLVNFHKAGYMYLCMGADL